jgi:hypothetical protein
MLDAMKVPEVLEPVPGTAHRETCSRFQVPYRGNRTGEPVSGTDDHAAQLGKVGTTQRATTPGSPSAGMMLVVRRPLPSPTPPVPTDERLVQAISDDTGVSASVVRHWLEGGSVPSHMRERLREALWHPLGGFR